MKGYTYLLTTAVFSTVVSSHMLLSLPSTWGLSLPLENPLNSGTRNWFCAGKTRDTNSRTTINAGSSITVPIVCGEAIDDPTNGAQICSNDPNAYHGGGGCALSVAFKSDPSIEDFYMFSIAENCPASNRAMITFQTPANMPSGDAVCAWTWIPDPSASADEMYMNCFNCRINGDGTGSIVSGTKLEDHLWGVPGSSTGNDRGLYKDVFQNGALPLQVSFGTDIGTGTGTGTGTATRTRGTATQTRGAVPTPVNESEDEDDSTETPTPTPTECTERTHRNRNRNRNRNGRNKKQERAANRRNQEM
jgi:hypothetical protein